jgi:cytochrome o ubiquinol oxidase subunit I
MLWSIGFMVTFVIGGMTGVLLAVPPADFVLHNSLFLVAHFHNVIIGGVLFGALRRLHYWFPKAFGFTLHEGSARRRSGAGSSASTSPSCRSTCVGLMGMTRRMQHYDVAGMAAVAAGRRPAARRHPGRASRCRSRSSSSASAHREELRDVTGDPWNGRTLEWATPRRRRPSISRCCRRSRRRRLLGDEAAREQQARARRRESPRYEPIEMPRNSPTGFVTAFFATSSPASR